jgi:ribosomal protein S27E
LEDLSGTVNGLDAALGDLRAQGYIYGRGWEAQVEELQERWPAQRRDATRQLERERRSLNTAVSNVTDFVDRASRSRDTALVDTAEDRVWSFERRVREAEQRVRGAFDQAASSVNALQAEFNRARAVLEAVDEASFSLFPEEHAFAVAEAAWEARGNEPIDGVLFLTDSRVIFEKREKVTTKKFLFIPTERKMVQEMLWYAPVGGVEVRDVQDEKRFLRRNKELLVLRMEGGEGPPEVIMDLKRIDNETWSRWIRRAREGRLEGERFDAVPPAPESAAEEESAPEAESASESDAVPTRCPSCGADLPTIYKGMHEVSCEYCGTTVPLT